MIDRIGEFASANPWPTAVVGGVLGLVALTAVTVFGKKAVRFLNRRRKSGRLTPAQIVTTLGALVSTAVGANTAWRFAESHLHVEDKLERGALFMAGEIILFGLALAARQNLTGDMKRTGAPGVLVWVISAFLAVPAWTESQDAAGHVSVAGAAWRIVLGPLGAALMWHFAMNIELRHAEPTAENNGFAAQVVRRVQHRVMAALGIRLGQDAEEALRDRARAKAADLIDRYNALASDEERNGDKGRRLMKKLMKQLRMAGVSRLPESRAQLLADLAVSSHARSLAQLRHVSPWLDAAVAPAAERVAVAGLDPLPASRAALSLDPAVPGPMEPGVAGSRETVTEESGDGPDDDGPDGPGSGSPAPADEGVAELLEKLEADLAAEQQPVLDPIHVSALSEARYDTDRIRYAIGVLHTYQQPVLNSWLQQHGYTVNRGSIDKVSKKHAEQQRQTNIVPLRRSTGTGD
ncbi:hypothetical protein ACFV4P_34415 [Kitasatospora sp. NPDC059795]|uniref:hypothetical protein n=1 Tax=Kitasatospora sp. NPDC059795 TaxID=3346949 RepID=UPI0036518701